MYGPCVEKTVCVRLSWLSRSLRARMQITLIEFRLLGLPWWPSGKESAYSAGDMGLIPGLGRFPGEGNGNLLYILAWEIPQTEEPGGLQSTGHKESDMTEQLHHHHHTHTELRNITDTESSSPHTHWIPITTSPPSGGLASSWTLSVTVKSLQLILFRVEWYALKLCVKWNVLAKSKGLFQAEETP